MTIEPTGLPSAKLTLNESGSSKQAKGTRESGEQSQNGSVANNLVDKVTLTASAEQLLALEEKLNDVPEIDTQRVNQIRDAIEKGNYKIDATKVAGKFLDFEKSLP